MTPINLKLVNLLNSLSGNEIREFKKFLSSGLYASGRNYMPLLNYLIKYKSKGLDNVYAKDVYTKLYPGKKFSKQTLKNRFSELYKLGEEFLIYLGMKEDKQEKDKILLRMLIEKKLLNPFESKYNKTISYIENEKYDEKKYENLLALKENNMEFLSSQHKVTSLYNQYHEISQLKLCVYLTRLFEIGFEFGLQEYDNRKYEFNHVVDFLKRLNVDDQMDSFFKSDIFIYRLTAMNYYLYKAFKNPELEEYYLKSHKMFTEISSGLKEDYKILKFNQMIHYCIVKQNDGVKKFQHELFKLYNEKLSQGLFADLQNNIYLSNNFRDYVYIGIALGKYKWVEDFVKKYSKELPVEFRENEIKLSFAKLDVAAGNYEKALLKINDIKAANYLLYMNASVLKLCCYYELGLFEEAFLELDKLKHYIRNHKEIPKVHASFNNNFIRFYQKLLKFVTLPNNKDIGFLEKEINQAGTTSRHNWLLEKVQELNS